MRKKLNCKWRKGWQKVDETESGYAETVYECFDYIKPIPLIKYSDGNMWYISDIKKECSRILSDCFITKPRCE